MRATIKLIRTMLVAALITGAVAGWIAFLTTDGTEAVAAAVASLYPLLILVLPAIIVLSTWVRGSAPLSPGNVVGQAIAAVLGALLGTLVFWIMASMAVGTIGGEDLNAVRDAILGYIPPWQVIVVVVVAALVAAATVIWPLGRSTRSQS